MLFTTVRRKDAKKVIEIINAFNPTAFYTIDEVRVVSEGYLPQTEDSIFAVFRPLFQKNSR
jgi:uncharacterized membrane-anchored protein YitT (DUF2179 family)